MILCTPNIKLDLSLKYILNLLIDYKHPFAKVQIGYREALNKYHIALVTSQGLIVGSPSYRRLCKKISNHLKNYYSMEVHFVQTEIPPGLFNLFIFSPCLTLLDTHSFTASQK